jgi:hypothetical protein
MSAPPGKTQCTAEDVDIIIISEAIRAAVTSPAAHLDDFKEIAMRKVLLPLLIGGLLVVRAAAEDRPHDIVEKAIMAQGGMEKLSQVTATRMTIKGKLPDPAGFAFTGETYHQLPDRFKQILSAEVAGTAFRTTLVYDGSKARSFHNKEMQPLTDRYLTMCRQEAHVDRVLSLVPLLRDKLFKLSILPATTVEGQPALGIKATYQGQPDVSLYFDKTDGLLLKSMSRRVDPSAAGDVWYESLYQDYHATAPGSDDEQRLKAAGIGTDGPALLEVLRKRTPSDADNAKVTTLIRQLGDGAFDAREKATAALVERGAAVIPDLQNALKDADPEIKRRAAVCLERIKKEPPTGVPAAAVRLLAMRRPPGAAEVLLAYLPHATDAGLANEVVGALAAVAFRDGQPDPALDRARTDSNPLRRAAALKVLDKAEASKLVHRVYLEGIKRPMKIVSFHDGKRYVEYEVIEVSYYNRFDDGVFTGP